jgi:hypothetical protein
MKKVVLTMFLVVLAVLLVPCAFAAGIEESLKRPLSDADAAIYTTLGSVQTTFVMDLRSSDYDLYHFAYGVLIEEALKKYQGSIDVRNMNVTRVKRGLTGKNAEWRASGVVVLPNSAGGTGVEGALTRAANETLKNVPEKSKIAIVYITAMDRGTTDYVAGELEYIWVRSGYTIIDRSQLDRIRREQNYQTSGEVDDFTAVAIGKIAGADIIVTGAVDGEGNLRRLRLRALDTKTAQVVGAASERL